MRVGIINQARMGSTRFPGKVLKKVQNRPLLDYQLERLKKVELSDILIVATTTHSRDDPIVELCKSKNVEVFRGSEKNVLERYYQAAKQYQLDTIVRVTADCPVLDPKIVDRAIAEFQNGSFDYVSNCHPRTYPKGMDVEVFSFSSLEKTYQNATSDMEKEHVTIYIYQDPQIFHLKNFKYEEGDFSTFRCTVDTKEDFQFIQEMLEHIYPKKPDFSLKEILHYLFEYRYGINEF